jgi:hypothetical protein
MSEWFAMRAMAMRLRERGYGADEIAEAMHEWVDDARKAVIEADRLEKGAAAE